MKGVGDILDFRRRGFFRFGLLLLSSLLIASASVLAYGRLAYERVLTMGPTNGGGGSASGGVNLSPDTVWFLVVLTFIISLSVFVFLREVFKRTTGRGAEESLQPGSLSIPAREEEWEESPRKEETQEQPKPSSEEFSDS